MNVCAHVWCMHLCWSTIVFVCVLSELICGCMPIMWLRHWLCICVFYRVKAHFTRSFVNKATSVCVCMCVYLTHYIPSVYSSSDLSIGQNIMIEAQLSLLINEYMQDRSPTIHMHAQQTHMQLAKPHVNCCASSLFHMWRRCVALLQSKVRHIPWS